MIKIALFCATGMSTSLMVSKMRQAAQSQGVETDISAHAEDELGELVQELHVVLLGPQVGYRLDQCKKICDVHDVPIAVISSMDYGMMRGDKVFNLALALHKEREASRKNGA